MITIDNDKVIISSGNESIEYGIGTPDAFRILSQAWLRSGWDNKYVYSFSWLGRPIIQLPEDMFRIQEIIYAIKPDVIIETGVAHGGSLIYYASICKALNHGRVIGVDIEIRPHNREAIESHPLSSLVTLIEGSSIAQETIDSVKRRINPKEIALVVLDACHAKDHVLAELYGYAPLVGIGSYIVVMDGIMESLTSAPRSQEDWTWNNPKQAAIDFVQSSTEFILDEPAFQFNEGSITDRVTYWPSGYLKRVRA